MLHVKNVLASTDDLVVVPPLFITVSIDLDTDATVHMINPLKPELNPICYLLALLGAHHFLHVSRIRVKLLTLS